MKSVLSSPRTTLLAAALIGCAILLGFAYGSGIDPTGFVSVVLRILHILAAMIWVGMIWFVNFIQLSAAQEADEHARAPLMRLIVPKVTATFLHASGATAVTGALLLPLTGYFLDRWVFPTVVYVSTPRTLMLWSGAVAGLAMVAIAHAVIRPALRIVLGEVPGDIETIARARARVATFARLNLILALPVTVVMVAASHG